MMKIAALWLLDKFGIVAMRRSSLERERGHHAYIASLLEAEIEQHRASRDSLDETQARLKDTVTFLTRQRAETRIAAQTAAAAFETLKQVQAEAGTNASAAAEARVALEALKQEHEAQSLRFKEAKAAAETAQRQIEQLRSARDVLQGEVDTAAAEVERLRASSAELQQRYDILLKELETTQAATNEAKQQLITTLSGLQQAQADIENERLAHRATSETLQAETEMLQRARGIHEDVVRELAEERIARKVAQETYEHEHTAHQATIATLGNERLQHKTQMEAFSARESEAIQLRATETQLQQQIKELQKKLASFRLPQILLNTLPKSASVYIAALISQGLGIKWIQVSNGYFPRDSIDWSKLKAAAVEGSLSQDHFDSSVANLQIIRAFGGKLVLHLRDPRQATLSMVHNLIRVHQKMDRNLLLNITPTPPEGYFDLSLQAQIDWHIDHYLPVAVRWIKDWLAAIDTNKDVAVLVTTYESFIKDEEAYIRRILDFYGISWTRFTRPDIKKSEELHFRQGTLDEWRRVFTPDQMRRATALVPKSLLKRFGWRP